MVLDMAGHPNEYNTNTFHTYDAMMNPTGESHRLQCLSTPYVPCNIINDFYQFKRIYNII